MTAVPKKNILIPVLMGIIVYFSYCAMSWYSMRGSLAYYGEYYGWGAWLVNDVWAFFLGGIVPFLLFELISSFVFKMLTARMRDDNITAVHIGLMITVTVANLALFGLKFIYLSAPMYAVMLDAILDPAVTLLFVGIYMWIVYARGFVKKQNYSFVLMQVMGTFIAIYGLLSVVGILSAVS